MATPPVSSITPPSPPTAPPPSTQSNVTSDTPPPSSPSTPVMSSPPPSQSPPPPDLQSPPPSQPVTPPPITTPPQPPSSPPPSPPASPPPSPPAAPPPAATSSPPQILSPPPSSESSPPPPSKVSPPPPSKVSPPSKLSPPPPPPPESSPPSKSSPPPQPPPLESSPPLDFSPPPPEDTPRTPVSAPPPAPPEKSLTTPPSPPDPLSPTTSPSPPIVTSSPPPISFPTPPANSSTSGSLAPPLASLPTEKPTARSTTPGTNGSVTAISPKGGGGGMKPGTAVAVGVVVGFLALSLVVMAVWYTKRRKKRNGSGYDGGYVMPSPFASSHNSDSLFMRPQNSPKLAQIGSGSNFMFSSDPNSKSWFTYEELYDATQGFSSHKLLGEGGFGCVYKGLLVDGREVAVKQLKIGGGQGEREFKAEVEIISRVHHRYLVSLVGYCISDHQRLLVYEYLPNDTLHYHLHGEGRPVMEWSTRVKVAAGAARGIAYLHEDCQPRIIHRDIKSSNILLDNNFDARVADFGLAKLAADANTHVTTRVMGTFGYMAPEYASSGKLTEKSDVFSYGVVLLELITGRKSVDGSQPLGDESLVEWARPLLNEALEDEKFEALIDPRLGNNYVELEMFRMIEAAAACIRHSAPKRPQMSQVVRAFDPMNEYPDLTNGMKLGQSEIYNSREHSAQLRMFQRLAFPNQGSSSEYDDHSHSSWKSSKLGSST